MHLHDLMGWSGPMTHRQFLAWQAWERLDIEEPQRAEIVYTMQVAQAAAGYKTNLQDHRLEIVTDGDEDTREVVSKPETPKQRAAAMKSIVSAATGSKWI